MQQPFRRKRQARRADLREPDRASLQCTAGAGSARCCCVTSPKSSSPRSDRRRRCSGRCMMPVRWCSPTSPAIRHAERAVAAGADGLVLLTAGAGGQTGWLNPVRVRARGAGVLRRTDRARRRHRDGHALRAAQALGCDLAYMGTKFIATRESMADPAYKDDAGREQRRRHPADARRSRACRPTCCGRRSRPPDSIPTICPRAAPSTSARTSTSAPAKTAQNAGRISGAPGIRRRA